MRCIPTQNKALTEIHFLKNELTIDEMMLLIILPTCRTIYNRTGIQPQHEQYEKKKLKTTGETSLEWDGIQLTSNL